MKPIIFPILLLFPFLISANDARIVAVADVHGALDQFVSILQSAKILDQSQNWSGEKTIFVQTGDVLDRGIQGRQVLDLLMKLENQASRSGGKVYPLLGNHEVMVMMGDLRYVSAEEYGNFAGKDSQKLQKKAFEETKNFLIRKAEKRKQPLPQFTPEMEVEWMKNHPMGFVEHREAFGPLGHYGKWLRKRIAVLDLNHNVFLHGGLSPKVVSFKIEEINNTIRREIELFDRYKKTMLEQKLILPFFKLEEMIIAAREELEIRQKDETLEAFLGLSNWLSINPDGPLWFRGYANWTDEEMATAIPEILETYKARRFIVGHSVQPKGNIRARSNVQVLLIDTGMNAAFFEEGRASALEVLGDRMTAIYGDEMIVLNP